MAPLRLSFFVGSGICFLSLAIAYFYMERYLLLVPCPLCILDRLVVLVLACGFLISAFVGARGQRVLWGLNVLALAFGFVFAGRHIWLQRRVLSEDVGCLTDAPGADTITEIIRLAFAADGDCGAVYWEFWGLSIAEQVLLLFIGIAALLVLQAVWMRR